MRITLLVRWPRECCLRFWNSGFDDPALWRALRRRLVDRARAIYLESFVVPASGDRALRGNLKNKRETHTELAAELLQKSRPAFTIDRGRQIGLGDGFAVGPRAFRIALIKPSHYDEDGYVIQWRRSYIPSNSLASVYALIKDCAQTNALGPDVAIEIEACDECNSFVNVRAIARRIRAAGGGMVGLVGVQSNQFPRALDLGR